MKRQERPTLVIADCDSEFSVPCVICKRPFAPLMGPQVFLADNLNAAAELGPTGIVCRKCTQKHWPVFARLLEIASLAGLYWRTPTWRSSTAVRRR